MSRERWQDAEVTGFSDYVEHMWTDPPKVFLALLAGVAKWWIQLPCLPRIWRTKARSHGSTYLLLLSLPLSFAYLFALDRVALSEGILLWRFVAFLAAVILLEAWVLWRTRRSPGAAPADAEPWFGWWQAMFVAVLGPFAWLAAWLTMILAIAACVSLVRS